MIDKLSDDNLKIIVRISLIKVEKYSFLIPFQTAPFRRGPFRIPKMRHNNKVLTSKYSKNVFGLVCGF